MAQVLYARKFKLQNRILKIWFCENTVQDVILPY
jgi:hypothetical protein